jgi:hypothetical protein
VSRLRSLSLAGVPVKGKIYDGQDETPLERTIKWRVRIPGLPLSSPRWWVVDTCVGGAGLWR